MISAESFNKIGGYKMKRYAVILISLLVSLSLIFSGCSKGQQMNSSELPNKETESKPVKPIDLSFISLYPEKHPVTIGVIQPWIKSLEETKKVKVNFLLHNTIAPQKEAYNSTVSGMIDISTNIPGQNPDKFPFALMYELPFMAPSSEAGSLLQWEMNQKYPEIRKGFEDSKLLWLWAGAAFQLNTKKPVKTLDDLKGMKIIGWSPALLDNIKLLGANPIESPPTDTYLALERGTADGVLLGITALRSWKISEVTKYHTIVNLGIGPLYGVMNKEKFNSLPPDVQKIVEDNSGLKMSQELAKAVDKADSDEAKLLKSEGHTFYVLPESEVQKAKDLLKPLQDKWVKNMEAKGYANAREILNDALRIGEEVSKKTGRGYQE